jgi:hypothetical protein
MSQRITDQEDENEEFLRLQRRPAEIAPHPKSAEVKQRQRRDRFVQVPLWWAEQMTKATETPRAFVGIWLLHLAWKTGRSTFPLPNGQLEAYGIGRKVKYGVLHQLEAAELIKVDRRRGKSPLITLLYL